MLTALVGQRSALDSLGLKARATKRVIPRHVIISDVEENDEEDPMQGDEEDDTGNAEARGHNDNGD